MDLPCESALVIVKPDSEPVRSEAKPPVGQAFLPAGSREHGASSRQTGMSGLSPSACAIAGILLVTVLCHAPALRSPFFADDEITVLQNPYMKKGTGLLHYFAPDYWRRSHGVMLSPYRPVREILLGCIRRLKSPPDARLFHAVNLGGHMANAALVYLVALVMLRHRAGALVAAVVFALHPAHVEVVGWIKNLGEVGSVFFALLSMLAYWRGMQVREQAPFPQEKEPVSLPGPPGDRHLVAPRKPGRPQAWLWVGLSTLAFALAILTKESAVSVPLILAAWVVLSRRGKQRRDGLVGTIPLWVLMIAYAVLQSTSQEIAVRNVQASLVAAPGVVSRSLLVLKTVMRYLHILVLPVWHVPWRDFGIRGGDPVWMHVTVCASAAAVGGFWVWSVRRWRAGAAALFWAVVALGPASNVVINTGRPLAEQRLYFPSAGWAVFVGALAAVLTRERVQRKVAAVVFMGLCVVCGALQFRGLMDWSTERALWVRSVRMARTIVPLHTSLANAYVKLALFRNAAAEYRRQIALGPGRPDGYVNLGAVLGRMGSFDEALSVLETAARQFPGNVNIPTNLGTTCFRRSQFLMSAGDQTAARLWLLKAREYFETTRRLRPDSAIPCANLGGCYLESGQYTRAREMLRRALKIDPEFAVAHYNLGRVCANENKLREAARHYEQARRFNPNMLDAHESLAGVYEALNELEKAEAAWLCAANLANGWHAVNRELAAVAQAAILQERLGKIDAAHRTWRRAARLAPGHPDVQAGLRRTARP